MSTLDERVSSQRMVCMDEFNQVRQDNKRLDKMTRATLGSVIENIGICCGELLDDDVIRNRV